MALLLLVDEADVSVMHGVVRNSENTCARTRQEGKAPYMHVQMTKLGKGEFGNLSSRKIIFFLIIIVWANLDDSFMDLLHIYRTANSQFSNGKVHP